MFSRFRLSGRAKQALRVFFFALVGCLLFSQTVIFERANQVYFDYRLERWSAKASSEEVILPVLVFQYQESTRASGFTDDMLLELLEEFENLGATKVYLTSSTVFEEYAAYRSRLPKNVELFDIHETTGNDEHRAILFLDTEKSKLADFLDSDGNLRSLPWDHPAVEFAKDITLAAGGEVEVRGKRLFLKPDSSEVGEDVGHDIRGASLEEVYGHLREMDDPSLASRKRELYEGRVIIIEKATVAATSAADIPTSDGVITAGQTILRVVESFERNWTVVEFGPVANGLLLLLIVGGTSYLLSGRRPVAVSILGTICVFTVVLSGGKLLPAGFDAELVLLIFGQVLAILLLVLLEVRRGRDLLDKFGGAEDAKFEGEETEATMVFTNLPPFLMEMERNHDEKLLAYRREYNEVLAVIASNYHGKVLDYQGDAQMLGFGLRYDEDSDHPAEGTSAALEIVSEVALLAERWGAPAEQLRVHAGVCTGSIALGHLGAQQKQDIAAIGDTTNTAARLMGAAMKQKLPVVVAKPTYVRAEGVIVGASLPAVELKGKSAPVEVYRADSVDHEWQVRNRQAKKDVSPTGGTIAYSGEHKDDLVRTVLFGVVGLIVAILFWADGTFVRAEDNFTDQLHLAVGLTKADPDIIIFGIDEASVSDSRLGRFPWSRGVYAQAIRNLESVNHKGVFFDIMFKRARKGDLENDQAFAEALHDNPNVVVAGVLYRDERFRLTDPLLFPAADFELLRSRNQLGLIHVARDLDGVARWGLLSAQETASHDSAEGDKRTIYPAACSALILGPDEKIEFGEDRSRVFLGSKVIPSNIDSEGKAPLAIRFGPATTRDGLPPQPGSYRLESFNRLLDASDPIFQELDGKYILVGQNLTTGELNAVDRITTVVGDLKGVEVHARLLDCLINDSYFRLSPHSDRLITILVVAGFTIFLLARYRSAKAYLPRLFFFAVFVTSFQVFLFAYAGVQSEIVTQWAIILIVGLSMLIARYLLTYRALAMVIPKEVATELLYHHGTEDRRQVATILLTDIRGYTTLSEGRTAVAMLDVLNEYHKRTVACYERYGGQALTYQGDAQIVIFGVFGNRKNPAADGVAAALGLQAICDQLREEWGIESRDDFDVGAGLCTGEVEVGLLGGGGNMQYSVVGETVRKAHKVQSLSADLEAPVILDEETYEATSGAVDVDDLGLVQPKGLPHEIRLYRANSVNQ